jgi:hypothetical protein
VLGEVQFTSVAGLVQAHVTLEQHAPWHGLGVQEPLQKKVTPAPAHAPAVDVAHAPVATVQQTPGHGIGVQELLGPM